MDKSNKDYQKDLDPQLYKVAREKGTEEPFSGKYTFSKEKGIYTCAVCENPLFDSKAKFDSSTGWPSFDKAISEDAIKYEEDNSLGMHRIEIKCAKCDSHLGHVFDDGPTESGKRYCLNSICLNLKDKS